MGHHQLTESPQIFRVSPITGLNPAAATLQPRIELTTESGTPPVLADETENALEEPADTSFFESFLLWPMDDDLEHSNIGWISPGLSTHIPDGQRTRRTSVLPQQGPAAQSTSSGVQSPFPSDVHDAFASKDTISEENWDILVSEDYGHVPKPSVSMYEQLCAIIVDLSHSSNGSPHSRLPPLEVLHVCVQLYFEHFHRGFPLLHKSTFKVRKETSLLYLAVAAVGSQYSRLSNRVHITTTLLDIIRRLLLHKLGSAISLQNDLELAQAMFLVNFALSLAGTREGIWHVQYHRNVLLTMCRPLLTPGVFFERSTAPPGTNITIKDWSRWVVLESWKRLVYFTWMNECLQLILFDLPPLITVEDMQLSVPCNNELWECANFHDWEWVTSSQREPQPSHNLLDLLRTDDIIQTHGHSLSDTTLLIAAFAVYIGERQYLRQQTTHACYSKFDNFQIRQSTDQEQYDESGVDRILCGFQNVSLQHYANSVILLSVNKFVSLFRLLRFIPYRLMYVASRWMSERQEAEAAAEQIAQHLKTKPRQARRSLVHAASLFRIIRSQQHFDPYDSFILLMSVLYVRYYDRFVIPAEQRDAYTAETAPRILRIDQDLDEHVHEEWIEGNTEVPVQLHVSGVGVLNGQDSVPRALREAIRILSHDGPWCQQSNAIGRALRQILAGEAPSLAT